ncbi:MAG: DUF4404 family protein [Planctomycetales bacterium]|nr:DUF4404 family protein [Planctomycetales bacterium]
MSQQADQLQATLNQLHEQLGATGADLDATTRAQLQETLQEIAQVLGGSSASGEEASITDRLRGAEIQFEESHPTLAGTIRRLVDMLAQMGI